MGYLRRQLFLDPNLPEKVAVCLAQISTSWSTLEYYIAHAISEMLSVSPAEARILTTQMNIRPKIEILALLAEYRGWPAHHKARLKKFTARIDELNGRRELIHGVWARDRRNNLFVVKYWGGAGNIFRISGSARSVRVSSLQDLAANVRGLTRAFAWWWNNKTGGPLASRRRRETRPRKKRPSRG